MTTDPLFFDDVGSRLTPLAVAAQGAFGQPTLDEHFPWHRIRRMSRK